MGRVATADVHLYERVNSDVGRASALGSPFYVLGTRLGLLQELHRFLTASHSELLEDLGDVAANGDRRDREPLGDLGGGAAVVQELEDFPLAIGQFHAALAHQRQPSPLAARS